MHKEAPEQSIKLPLGSGYFSGKSFSFGRFHVVTMQLQHLDDSTSLEFICKLLELLVKIQLA
jgi:hypothetical protein